MKIYLAGPDVFRPDVADWADSARALCRQYGFDPLLPVDHPESTAEGIFHANIALIRRAQVVVANLSPFRGAEPDSGTVFEVGYAHALGKKVVGYVADRRTVAERVRESEGGATLQRNEQEGLVDQNGWSVEDFGLPCNLMLAVPILIVEGGLEACLQSLRTR